MKKILIPTLVLFALFVLASFATPERKLEKLAAKVWTEEVLELREVAIADSLKLDLGTFYEIHGENGLVGYACATTAFGCRIGGCAAPTNPNVQSYETFDYVVIYNKDLTVAKVDITNYGGQYGYQICRAKWLEQFEGKAHGYVLEENIDGISGATVSAQFLIDDLNAVGLLLKTLDLSSFSTSKN